jgi:hypothetical protein
VYYRSLALAQRAASAGDEARARRYLERCPAHVRQWEWHALAQQACRADRVRWPRPEAPVSALACSPDGNCLAALGYDAAKQLSVVTVWGGPNDPDATWGPRGAPRTALAWAPDSAWLLTIDAAGELRQFFKHGVLPGEFFLPAGPHQAAAVAPRGVDGRRWLVCVVDGPLVRVRDGDHRQPPRVLAGAGARVVALACCPETNALATGDRDGVVRVWDLITTRLLATLEGHTAPVTALAFAPGGRRLVSGARDDSLCVWDPTSGREVLRLPGPAGGPTALAFRPDGRRLVVARDFDITEWGDGPIRWEEFIRNGPP